MNDLSVEKPKSRPLMMLHYIHRCSVTLESFRTYTKTHLTVSSWPFRPLSSSTGIQNSLILISSFLRTRAKDEETWENMRIASQMLQKLSHGKTCVVLYVALEAEQRLVRGNY